MHVKKAIPYIFYFLQLWELIELLTLMGVQTIRLKSTRRPNVLLRKIVEKIVIIILFAECLRG